jgi:hypothetical protein
MQRKNLRTAMRYLVAVCALISALAIVGCGGGGGGDESVSPVTSGETVSNVNTGPIGVSSTTVQALVGLPATFSDSFIFDPSLGHNSATLTFTGSGNTFDLDSGGSTSSGDTTFGSCILTYRRGPLGVKSITFPTCTFQVTASNVTAGGGAVSGTLTLTLSGPFGSGTCFPITVQIRIAADGSLLINDRPVNITISVTGAPVTSTTGTGTTGTGGTP